MSNVRHLNSIQGEQQLALDLFADQATVDTYVEKASPRVITCRQRVRHIYPPTLASTPLVFVDTTDDGLFVREPQECTVCGCAVRVELWEAFKSGGQYRYRMVATQPTSYKRNEDGDEYLLPSGMGRAAPKQIREAVGSKAMAGVAPSQLKKDIAARKLRDGQRRGQRGHSGQSATQREVMAPQFSAR